MRVTHKRSYTPRMKGTSEDEMVLELVLEVKKENQRGGMICSSRKDIVLYIYILAASEVLLFVLLPQMLKADGSIQCSTR